MRSISEAPAGHGMSSPAEPLPAPPSSLEDWRGIRYSRGARIFYPIARNSSSYMVEAIVECIDWDPYGAKRYERYGGRLPNVRVKVKVLGDSTRNKRSRDWAYPTTGSITVV